MRSKICAGKPLGWLQAGIIFGARDFFLPQAEGGKAGLL